LDFYQKDKKTNDPIYLKISGLIPPPLNCYVEKLGIRSRFSIYHPSFYNTLVHHLSKKLNKSEQKIIYEEFAHLDDQD
jgi:hypothetical protein